MKLDLQNQSIHMLLQIKRSEKKVKFLNFTVAKNPKDDRSLEFSACFLFFLSS